VDFERLLAKSARDGKDPRPAQTIRKHTSEVMKAADRLVEVTGRAQLKALGLAPDIWFDRFRREIRVAALLHDLGKANSHFQGMVQSPGRSRLQGLRHEAVSFLIARLPEVRAWVGPRLSGPHSIELMLWALAGHHRKFPPPDPPVGAEPAMKVYLSHPDFRAALALGTRDLGLGEPPTFTSDRTLKLTHLGGGMLGEFKDAQEEAQALMRTLSAEERRFVAALKACLICADVAGSIGRRGTETMVDWIPVAFERAPTVEQLEGIVTRKLGPYPRRPFQEEVAGRQERVVLVRAGCGSGKTLAAYLWAAHRAPGRRLFFCYPTTGTATEGYRDYLIDPTLGAELVHGRAEVDMTILGLGDDEPGLVGDRGTENQPGRAAADSAGALEQWSTPLVSCTVDTVLGLVQNNRRGLYAWPSIAGSACVFDEIHAYDDALFAALLRFLADVRGVPCLLMTASLPEPRLRMIGATLADLGEGLAEVAGPTDLEGLKRYRREQRGDIESAWEMVQQTLARDGKVLWVVNTVDAALRLADDPRATRAGAILYHSRFRYRDRVERHKEVIDAFKAEGRPALAITTQVAEMSLDLSADLLVTHLAPIPSLIQRLGRLHRRAEFENPLRSRPFLILEPDGPLPYTEGQLDEARRWLESLGDGDLSQAELVEKWLITPEPPTDRRDQFIWLDGGFVTEPRPLRESTPGIEVILSSDREDVELRRRRPEEVRIPMIVPNGTDWRCWPEVAFCKIPPTDRIEYDARKGARWRR
jgi:CRISPR-associated endonuclease/helicase Cas3